jgi:hypothetical protein
MIAAPLDIRDSAMASRFDQRVLLVARAAIPVHGLVIVGMAPFGSSVVAPVAHLVMAVAALWMAHRTRDGIKFIIFSHVYWTFSFATSLFAALHLQGADHGLGDADRAALIALVAQVSLWIAFLFSPRRDPLSQVDAWRRLERQQLTGMLVWPLLVVGVVGVVAEAAGLLSPVVGQSLTMWLYLGLGVLAAQTRRVLHPLASCALLVIVAVAVVSNGRSGLFGVLLFLAFLALVRVPKLLSFKTLVISYVGWRLMTVFSAISLSVRWARNTGADMVALFSEAFFTIDTLWAVLNPLHVHAAELQAASEAGRSGFYSEFLGGSVDILGRLALLPQMDIVTRHIDPFGHHYADQFWTVVGSALPSLGQAKQLIFSDVVVWDLGLRAGDSVGRPMITAQGELFAMGGYLAVFCVTGVCSYALHLLYRQLVRSLGARTPVILLFPQLMATTMLSTTLLSTVAGTMREPLLMILTVGAAGLAFGTMRSKGLVAHASDMHP